jgi:hypothetical protein
MQRRQCKTEPRCAVDRDTERRVSDYTAGFVDGESDRADASLRSE